MMAYQIGKTRAIGPWHYFLRVTLFALALMMVQAVWISRFLPASLRVDLLLPLMFGVAIEWSPLTGLLWALLWGYVMDTLAGEFWGFHVGSYVVAICLVNIAAERFEFYNVLYQVAFVGVCALGQSVALGLFLSLASSGGDGAVWSMWASLLMRGFLITVLAPLILYPFAKMQRRRV